MMKWILFRTSKNIKACHPKPNGVVIINTAGPFFKGPFCNQFFADLINCNASSACLLPWVNAE
jgi:hypothetical protein